MRHTGFVTAIQVLSGIITTGASGVLSHAQAQQAKNIAPAPSERPAYFDKPVTDDEFRLSMDAETSRKVDKLIVQLSDPNYKTRQQAQEALIQVGAAAMSRLRDAYHNAEELETKLRIEQVAHSAYVNHHVLDKHGFLGISMLQYDPKDKGVKQLPVINGRQRTKVSPPVLPPGRVCVFVYQVIADTGAERAGLKIGDAIIAMDDVPVTGKGLEIRNAFSARIRKHKPGETIKLTVIRQGQTLTLTPTLTRAPEGSLKNVIVISALYREASDRFQVWWEKFFLHPPEKPDSRG